MSTYSIINRERSLFSRDIGLRESDIASIVRSSKFLVIGGAGSIGQAVVKEIFKRNPSVLHVIDISENNIVELVRDLRSSLGYIDGDFRTFALDCGSVEFAAMLKCGGKYDYVLNLSALKHVRSEKDPFTLMRLVEVNILNVIQNIQLSSLAGASKYFCVSTDKAANPVNMMGASKKIMEMFLMKLSSQINISTARFANVAFSDGSLPFGFTKRFAKNQPIAAPIDIKRYFVTPEESGELCLMSCLFGENRDIFFPKPSNEMRLTTFSEIAINYLGSLGYEAFVCTSEEEARIRAEELIPQKKWPCYFFTSDTTGEKDFEEFFTSNETIDLNRFDNIGIIKNNPNFDDNLLNYFLKKIDILRSNEIWSKQEIVDLFNYMLPDFAHKETGKYLDQRM